MKEEVAEENRVKVEIWRLLANAQPAVDPWWVLRCMLDELEDGPDGDDALSIPRSRTAHA